MELAGGDALPSGTVTFLLTDIEDSSGHWEAGPADMRAALADHDRVVAEVVGEHDGELVKHMGDGCWAAFASAPRAAAAALAFQRRHQQDRQQAGLPLRVRIGLHTGEIEPTDGDYFGPVVNRAARVVDLANGDQIVCSSATAGLLPDLDLRSEGHHELRGIGDDEVFLIRAPGVETDAQPLRRPIVPTNLPKPRTSLLGREEDLARASGFLEQGDPVVTLVGPGGVGKTRLAVEAARRVSTAFEERVYYCDLVPIADGDDDAVAQAVAEVVGARRQPGMTLPRSIVDHLTGRPTLVVVDNCEHVIEAVRDLAERLAEAEDVQILATSREALGLLDEQQVLVEPLPPTTTGVELFVDRARHRDPRFELGDDNVDAVREVVRRLDGIPLAIELAAARIRLMTPADLADRLAEGLTVLGGGRKGDRRSTLVDTVRWSYDLLDPPEAALFTRLSVFAGGFDLDAVEAVCADDDLVDAVEIPDLVMALVDKSIVVSDPVEGRQRFTMLETLRSFAAGELDAGDEGPAVRRRHADHFGGLARRQGERFWTGAEPEAWQALDAEWANVRTALDTFVALGDIDRGADLVTALCWYANTAMRFELFTWAERMLDTEGIESHRAYTDLCGTAALGEYFTVSGSATERAEAGLAADPSDPNGFCRATLVAVAMNNEHDREAADALTAAWLRSEPTTTGGRLWAECFRTFYLCNYDPTPEAAAHVEAAAGLAEDSGSITARVLVAWARGQVVHYEDRDDAIAVWRDGLEWCRSLPGDHLFEHLIEGLILHVTARRAELAALLHDCRDAVQGAVDRHYHAGTSHLMGVTAIALCRAGDAPTGARLVGAMMDNGHQPRPNARRALEEALGADLDRHLARGHGLSVTQAAQLAITALDTAIDALDAAAPGAASPQAVAEGSG